MSLARLTFAKVGYICVLLGVVGGTLGWVKIGSGVIAIGAGIVSYSYSGSTRIERYLPLALAVCLMVMAIALPGKR